ncbi:type VI secretion system-associated protein TagO [Agaribacterium sp. ZY112]|uniref:type VI secretion system-associated protein TagO n=1 Tax=Agaribacterium sp. ZY112 TaxID=3233574 RepID=UPI003525D6D0
MKSRITLLVTLLISANTFAVDNKQVAKCATIDSDLARLECYDALAQASGLAGKQTVPTQVQGKGKWSVSVDVNPVDDSKTVTLSLDADSGQSKWRQPVYLIARCKSNKTEVYIGWNDYLGREAQVLTRVGSKKAVTSYWGMSTNSKATFHNKPIPFLKEMLSENKLVAQVTPYNESPVTAVFDISGLQNAIKPLRETCAW